MARHTKEQVWTPSGFMGLGDMPRIRHTPPKHRLPVRGDTVFVRGNADAFTVVSIMQYQGENLYVVTPKHDVWTAARTVSLDRITHVLVG